MISNAIISDLIRNPVIPGFNPDPSIVRVGEDYYLATSTFEWFPGVQIHHSRDLANWRLLTRPLNDLRLLDLRGIPNSGGIWAPCLSWADGKFWLCYTVVRELNSPTKDCANYLTTAENILGPWSDPVHLNSSGFDPSLFHDDDGRKWLLNAIWNHRDPDNPFYGINLQEYFPQTGQLLQGEKIIFKGTHLGRTEGPHVYKRSGYYYLITAEGGTGYEHAVTMARAKDINGPYEIHPQNPILTSWKRADLPMQKAGHADLVETQSNECYMVHLVSRPALKSQRCMMGRETAIQKVEWKEDGWLYKTSGRNHPEREVQKPDIKEHLWPPIPLRDDFDCKTLAIHFQSLRVPLNEENYSLSERPGFLRLRGKESLSSKFEQTLVARRREAFNCEASTCLEFEPETFLQMAGLVCYYSTRLFYFLCMSIDEKSGPCLYIQGNDNGKPFFPMGENGLISLNGTTRVHLRAKFNHASLTFFYSIDGDHWTSVGEELDASILSDDYTEEWGFTGTLIGMACQDLRGTKKIADFDYFEYKEFDIENSR